MNWTLADREHRLAFDKGLARLYESAANDRDGLAAAVLPGVNAFFRANDIRLQATADGLIPLGTTARIPMGRDMHERLLRVMVADARSSVLARELLHAWLKAADSPGPSSNRPTAASTIGTGCSKPRLARTSRKRQGHS